MKKRPTGRKNMISEKTSTRLFLEVLLYGVFFHHHSTYSSSSSSIILIGSKEWSPLYSELCAYSWVDAEYPATGGKTLSNLFDGDFLLSKEKQQ